MVLGFNSTLWAQFAGGLNVGYDSKTLVQTTCSDITPSFIFKGGNGDGKATNTLTQTNCPDLSPIFIGGISDGFASNDLTQGICPDITPNFIYIGGNNDGFAANDLIQGICPDLSPIFSGGNNDGFAATDLTQGICPDLSPLFPGGDNDGFASNDLVQGICPDLSPRFPGGNNDGFATTDLIQGICPDPTPNFIYYGGNNDGSDVKQLTQNNCPDPTPLFIFYGGNSDGFSWNFRQATPCSPIPSGLPIELISFRGMCNDLNVKLIWSTAVEINNDFFTLERSSDGLNFNEIAQIDGSGTINKISNYDYIDLDPAQGLNFYRLKQTDYDGSFNYSNPINVKCDATVTEFFTVYPNPAKSELNIEFFETNTTKHIEIIDAQGRLVFESDIINKTKINTDNYSLGVYLVKLSYPQNNSLPLYSYQKFIKE